MRIIEITESMGQNLANACEDALRANGRLMSCVEEVMRNNGSMGERSGRMGMRDPQMMGDSYMDMPTQGGYGNRYGDRYANGYGDRMPVYQPHVMYPQDGYMGERGYRY